jgi:DNA-binding beta-propeller fold protein YncE
VLTSWVSTNRRPLLLAAAVFIVTVAVGWPLAHRLASQSSPPSRPLPLRVIARTPLPGHDSRFDYAVVDPTAHRLFVDHMGDGTLLELDTRTDAVVATVPGLASVTGVIVVPALHRVFASAAGDGQVVTIDEDTAAVLARAPAGSFPDGLAYVPTTGQVWVSDEDGGAETVLDAHTGQRVATVRLGGEAGNVQYDATRDQVLVDVQTSDEVAVIDPHSRRITNRVPVPGCDHDHGLLVDGDRAFVACDGNNVLVTLSLPGLKPLRHVSRRRRAGRARRRPGPPAAVRRRRVRHRHHRRHSLERRSGDRPRASGGQRPRRRGRPQHQPRLLPGAGHRLRPPGLTGHHTEESELAMPRPLSPGCAGSWPVLR